MRKFDGKNMGSKVGNVMLPNLNTPQVFASNMQCPQPNIQTYQQPACNDPRTSVQVTKRVYETTVAEFWIADNGVQLQVGFGAGASGRNGNNLIPDDELVTVVTDSTSTGVVRDITIAYDGYAEDAYDSRAGDAGMNYGVFDGDVGRSYAECLSALLAGNIVIENVPFPTVIPIASAIKTVGGYSVFYDLGGITTLTEIVETVTLAQIDIFRFALSPELTSTHQHAPAPIEIALPESSNFPVRLEIPNRSTEPSNTAYANDTVYVWTGVLTILIEKKTSLGTLPTGGQQSAPAMA